MPPNESTVAGRAAGMKRRTAMDADEYIELELARMTAMPPLGGVARVVWGRAGIPDEPAGMVAEVGDQISTYIDDELRKRGISPDTRMLSALAEIVATAMIQQHEFTQLITNRSCLFPSPNGPQLGGQPP
jgi:hypothetical protein